ncbi:uncharacterized protein LOC108136678 [Drosophila elegans]|uniref:uncharacterized protein LOC108136678 n=1 Tax=Drosophila elegans TaxID=30023 RepID=UPI001BC83FBB|nr:uncharacterized protein LOC108136678 [Drosophila elegans]
MLPSSPYADVDFAEDAVEDLDVDVDVDAYSPFEFTNINYNSLDESFSKFEYCYLKSVNRTYKYMSLKVNPLKLPIRKIKHDVQVDKLPYSYFSYQLTLILPFPEGDYGFFSIWYADGIKRAMLTPMAHYPPLVLKKK